MKKLRLVNKLVKIQILKNLKKLIYMYNHIHYNFLH